MAHQSITVQRTQRSVQGWTQDLMGAIEIQSFIPIIKRRQMLSQVASAWESEVKLQRPPPWESRRGEPLRVDPAKQDVSKPKSLALFEHQYTDIPEMY